MSKKFFASVIGLVVAVGSLVMLNVTGSATQAVSSYRSCTDDAIIRCGAITEAELLSKYDSNVGDAKSIFAHYGIGRGELTGTTSQIVHGTVYQDGRVVVGGKTVATGAYSVSRVRFSSQSTAVTINGTTLYQGPDMSIFVRPVDAYVYMRNGQFYRAVLSSCGNPVVATPVKPETPPQPQPVYSCDSLKATKIDRTRFSFTSTATAKNGAEIVSYTYNYGDGNTQTVTSPTATHTYQQPGTYNVTVTVNVKVDGVVKPVTGTNCQTTVEVTPVPVTPAYACESLTATKINRTTYRFAAKATASGGAEIVNYTYNFGDGKSETISDTTVNHTYEKPGTYTATLTVNVKVEGATKPVTAASCKVTVKVEAVPVTPEYACESLTASKINRTTYRFTATATAENAQIVSYTYDFGDSTTRTVNDRIVNHTYAQPGTYTAKVSVNVKVNNETKVATSEACKVVVKVEAAPVTPADQPPVTPPAQVPVTPVVIPAEVPAELPQTGIETLVSGGLGLGSLTTAGYYWVNSRKNLLNALMKR